MKTIYTIEGKAVLVDAEDYDYLNEYEWKIFNKYVYVKRHKTKSYKEIKHTGMHRIIMGNPEGLEVHHINSDRMDNRKENLEVVSRKKHLELHTGERKCNHQINKLWSGGQFIEPPREKKWYE